MSGERSVIGGSAEHRSYLRFSAQSNFQLSASTPDYDELEVMELCVPMCIFVDCAVSFKQLHPEQYINYQRHYLLVLQLMAWVSSTAFQSPEDYVRLTMERVMDKDDRDKVIALRVRLMYRSATTLGQLFGQRFTLNNKADRKRRGEDTGADADDAAVDDKKVSRVAVNKKLLPYQIMSGADWRITCHALAQVAASMPRHSNDDPVEDTDSVYYPTTAFSVDASLFHAAQLGADESQCQLESYIIFDEESISTRLAYRFLYPQHVWSVMCCQFKPDTFQNYEFPFVAHPEIIDNKSKGLFMKLCDVRSVPMSVMRNNKLVRQLLLAEECNASQRVDEDAEEADCIEHGVNRKRKYVTMATMQDTFDQSMMHLPETGGEMTMSMLGEVQARRNLRVATLQAEQSEQFDEFCRTPDVTAEQKAALKLSNLRAANKLRRQMQKDGLSDFKTLFHEQGHIPDAHRATAKWIKEYLDRHDGVICRPHARRTCNLTPHHEKIAQFAVNLEIGKCSHMTHRHIIIATLGILDSQFGDGFSLHTVSFGPGAAGKSHYLNLVHKNQIPGTSKSIDHFSEQAFSAPSNGFSYMSLFSQEADPACLGMNEGAGQSSKRSSNGRSSKKETNNSKRESVMKTVLSEGIFSSQRLAMKDGVGTEDAHVNAVNSSKHFATNADASDMPGAMKTRFICFNFTSQSRKDNGGLAEAAARNKIPALSDTITDGLRRDQALATIIGQFCKTGIMAPVNMRVAETMFTKFQKLAADSGLTGTEDPRKREQFLMLVRAIVVSRAIDAVFDLENPDAADQSRQEWHTKRFMLEDVLECEKLLYATTEDVVLALGFCSEMFESPVAHPILNTIRSKLMNDLKVNEYIQLKEDGYYHFDYSSHERAQSSEPPRDYDPMRSLASLVLSKMTAKPQLNVVYEFLCELSQHKKERAFRLDQPSLAIDNGVLKIAKDVFDHNLKDKMYRLVQQMLTYKTATKRTYLWGVIHDLTGFLFKTMTVEPKPNSPELELRETNYVHPDLLQFLLSDKDEISRDLFPKNAYTIIDKTWDTVGEDLHLNAICLLPSQWKASPPSNVERSERYFASDDITFHYPQGFAQSNPDAFWAALKRDLKEGDRNAICWSNIRHTTLNLGYCADEIEAAQLDEDEALAQAMEQLEDSELFSANAGIEAPQETAPEAEDQPMHLCSPAPSSPLITSHERRSPPDSCTKSYCNEDEDKDNSVHEESQPQATVETHKPCQDMQALSLEDSSKRQKLIAWPQSVMRQS